MYPIFLCCLVPIYLFCHITLEFDFPLVSHTCRFGSELRLALPLGTLHGVIVSELILQAIVSKFDSHWVFQVASIVSEQA